MILELISLENESKAVQYMRVKCAKSNCREMVDYSTDIVKNHCVNVLIKLNLPQSILYKTRLRNLFLGSMLPQYMALSVSQLVR